MASQRLEAAKKLERSQKRRERQIDKKQQNEQDNKGDGEKEDATVAKTVEDNDSKSEKNKSSKDESPNSPDSTKENRTSEEDAILSPRRSCRTSVISPLATSRVQKSPRTRSGSMKSNSQGNLSRSSFECYTSNLVWAATQLLILMQYFHVDGRGICDGVDVQCNKSLTL